ncbi:energy-coupling factor ABC transporter ATP-binding protein [Bittarella massiliensis (ex Durand et al. 2017)]|uniref:energy-coupling factor ABC transporter ATP-binding protein n=1 Tax=Bittarella massiliensis (ex Durand et al. 2017) TaxID=1720313 RepID=UPI001AA111C3|nr:ABC transporter ATP-binding protein [Bittarella massiliensis (ex Durand et al. 2017)]MBO1679602.1 ABC transporter ATP-binding protein [Bittarella massiliensis (ex Durand et al. 2017)]
MSFITLQDVSYKYPLAKTFALKHVDLTFEKGKFYGIIGQNGAGKTTLCNLVRGLVPHFYGGSLTGKTIIDGTNVKKWDTDQLATQIGYVFQNPFTQISGVKETVFEEIALGLENLGIPKDEMIERVIRVCKLLKIEDLIKRDPNALSGGQRQRVAFAAIIAMDSDTLVIDEPTSQLDPEGTADVFAIIQLLKEQGKTVLLVEHKIDLLAEYADEIVVLEKAQVAFQGPAQEVLQNPALLEHGAQIPQVALLGSRLQERGIGLGRIPITQKDAIAAIEERLGGES